jgi:hypothetical protein
MLTIKKDSVHVDQQTSKLQGFRLEDTTRAPVIIVFIDEQKPQLLHLRQGQTPPTRVQSINMKTDIEIITYAEIELYLTR